jgi:hypothetical protein
MRHPIKERETSEREGVKRALDPLKKMLPDWPAAGRRVDNVKVWTVERGPPQPGDGY